MGNPLITLWRIGVPTLDPLRELPANFIMTLLKFPEISEKYEISEDVELKGFNTFKISSKAKYFVKVNTQRQLKSVLKLADIKKMPVFILGNGSNTIFLNKRINAFFIKLLNKKIKLIANKELLIGKQFLCFLKEARKRLKQK